MSREQRPREDIKILVVDDFTTMRKIVRTQLASLGYLNVLEARDASEAVQKLEFDTFDLIISDWHMPAMSGFQLLEHIRGTKRLEKIPFILLTKETDKESVLTAKGQGITHYLGKPFNADALEQKVLEALAIIPSES
jgi:two-component system chemotaxis response regulator CheY